MFRKSSLQIKWDSFRFREGRGEKERTSCRIYLMEKSCFSGGGSSAAVTPAEDWEHPVPVLHCLIPQIVARMT